MKLSNLFTTLVLTSPTFAAVTAKPTTSTTSPSCPSTLPLQNPGFESGSIAPWTHTFYHPGIPQEHANASIISPVHPGSYKLRVTWVRFVYGVFNLTQKVDGLCAGKTYNVSFDFQFHNWYLPYHPDECRNTVQLSGATALADTTFGPFSNGTWFTFNKGFKASKSGETNLTVTTTCATDPDEDSSPGWAAWYDNFEVKAVS